MIDKSVRYAGMWLHRAANWLQGHRKFERIWIDVGAHLGEHTFTPAQKNPSLLVYAFEPNIKVAMQRAGVLPNFVVIPVAVAEQNGCADFHINSNEASSSLLHLDPRGVEHWIGGDQLRVVSKVTVPTIRLDTFMNLAAIDKVDFLKVDAQGADLSVVRSAGKRIKDIRKITLETAVTPLRCYVGAPSKDELVDHMIRSGFALAEAKRKTHGQEENLTFLRLPDTS